MDQQEASAVVRDCEESRERAVNEPMSIATAIDRARAWRRQPELVVDSRTARIVADTLLAALERSRCYMNAVYRGQETFVLVQQDRAAPQAIAIWATLAAQRGCPEEKVEHAFRTAERWKQQPEAVTKWPD